MRLRLSVLEEHGGEELFQKYQSNTDIFFLILLRLRSTPLRLILSRSGFGWRTDSGILRLTLLQTSVENISPEGVMAIRRALVNASVHDCCFSGYC